MSVCAPPVLDCLQPRPIHLGARVRREVRSMRCYRLTYENTRCFDLLIDSARLEDHPETFLCVALIYRVIRGVREPEPLHRQGGTPIQIHAVSEGTTLRIATEVLHQVTGSPLLSVVDCSAGPGIPALGL